MAATYPAMTLDRTVSPELEGLLSVGGPLRFIVDRVLTSPATWDVQTRRVRGGESKVSLCVGLTSVLDVIEHNGTVTLAAHETHRAAGSFDDAWLLGRTLKAVDEIAGPVTLYVDTILSPGKLSAHLTDKEGVVQGALGAGSSPHYRCFQREAVVSFQSKAVRKALVDPLRKRIWDTMLSATDRPDWWPTVRDRGANPRLGLEIDALALDPGGRLLVIEAKPANEPKGIAWSPAQTRLYSEVIAMWLEVDPGAREAIVQMCEQRCRLGLPAPDWVPQPHASLRVVPVVAIGPSGLVKDATMASYLDRMWMVAAALDTSPPHSGRIDPLEVWRIDALGERIPVTQ